MIVRLLLTQDSKNELLAYLKKKNNAKSLDELAQKLKVQKGTFEKWFYIGQRYIPEELIPQEFMTAVKVIDRQENNWGQKKGGKKTYKIIIEKYGEEEIKRRQVKGGQNSALKNDQLAKQSFNIDIYSPLFLELYGALLGDGWLSSLSYQYKTKRNYWWVGISGDARKDKEYLMFLRDIIKKLFGKNAMIKYKKDSNGMEIIFCHKHLILFLNKVLSFPIGLKSNLKIESTIVQDWNKVKHVIRGIFDTDGCFYFDKTPAKKPYPCISIHMNEPILLDQIHKLLKIQNFKSMRKKDRIVLKGSIQINKWMREIGSSNPKHFLKYQSWKQNAPAA